MFLAKYQIKRVTEAILNCVSLHSLCCLMNRKGTSFQQSVSIGIIKCFAVSKAAKRVQMLSFGIDTTSQSFCYLFVFFIALPVRCSKSAQKSAVQVYQVATVVMKTTQLVLSQLKKLFIVVNELNKVSLCQKYFANVVNWWSYVILIVTVRFFETHYDHFHYNVVSVTAN